MKCVYCVNTFLVETFSHLETDSDIKMLMSKKLKHTAVFYYETCGTESIYPSYTNLFN